MTQRTRVIARFAFAAVVSIVIARRVAAQATRASSSPPPPSTSTANASHAPTDDGAHIASRAIALPGSPGPVRMDYLGYAPSSHTVWIPAGNTGRVDVLDTANDAIRAIEGFATVDREARGAHRIVGPSSVAIGDGVVFIGNRADSQICAVDPRTLARGECAMLESPPDGIVLIPAVHQLWVTLPRNNALAMLRVNGAARPTLDARLVLEGAPEGYAVDNDAAIFYTNLEDRNRTLAIDARTRRVVSNWPSGCSAEGPRGLAIDTARHQLFVGCTDRVVALDVANGGAVLGSIATGGGVDAIDYLNARHMLFVASGATSMLRVVSVDEHGAMRIVASATTTQGARNAVVDERGRAYVADSAGGRIFVTDAVP